jgi:hypothetical protein
MEEALTADGNPVPEGSTIFEREPLEFDKEDQAPEAGEPVIATSPDEPPAVS